MAQPQTSLHYTAGANVVNGSYVPATDGFNLADVSSLDGLNSLPAGVKGLVWLNEANGATASFEQEVNQMAGNPHLFGFYLADEPDPTGQWGQDIPASNLMAESDYIHAHAPGAKTFMVMMNEGSPDNPDYMNTYNPANTHIDLYGLDPYPIRSASEGGVDYNAIPAAVSAAKAAGIPQSSIVPIYQAFGGGTYPYSTYVMPTAAQEQQILSTWGSAVPNPTFDYAYAWGSQDGDTSLSGSVALQQVFAAHNASGTTTGPTPSPTGSPSVLTATDVKGVSAKVPLITSGTNDFSATLAGTVHQSASSGTDTVSASAKISSETLRFGSGSQEKMQFLGPQHVSAFGGSGSDTVTTGSGNDQIVAGTGTLDATGEAGADTFVFHANSGLLNIHDFSPQQGDKIVVDKSLRGSMTKASDGHGGVMLSFGTSGHGIDVLGHSSVPASSIHFS